MILPEIGQRFGAWEVFGSDATGKRIACKCSCGAVRIVGVAALTSGTSTSCGCAPLMATQREASRDARRRQLLLSDFGFFDKT